MPHKALSKTEQEYRRIIALLVEKLGGEVTLSSKELEDADDRLTLSKSYDMRDGWQFEVQEEDK